MPTLTINPPALHPGQRMVMANRARFKVMACGRRWGKTRLGSLMCIDVAVRNGRAWWVAPSYKMARVGWRLLTRLAYQIPGAEVRKADMMILLPTGGEMAVRSADNPDSLRGEGLDFVVMDECAFTQESAWAEALRPALSDRRGRALFISTPKGRNWFWHIYQHASEFSDWASWSFPTANNPYIDAGEIEAARQSLPERTFRQEYLAEFIDDAGGVFRRVMDAATARPLDRGQPGRDYAIGCDWGKHNDYTVFAVLDIGSGEMVHMDRFNQIDYMVQAGRLNALYQRFPSAVIIAEANSIGEPVIEQLQRQGLPVRPFQTTHATKTVIIDALALAFEQAAIRILPDSTLVNELQAYEISRTPSGLTRYSAPAGMHDDTVIALALAWRAKAWQPLTGNLAI